MFLTLHKKGTPEQVAAFPQHLFLLQFVKAWNQSQGDPDFIMKQLAQMWDFDGNPDLTEVPQSLNPHPSAPSASSAPSAPSNPSGSCPAPCPHPIPKKFASPPPPAYPSICCSKSDPPSASTLSTCTWRQKGWHPLNFAEEIQGNWGKWEYIWVRPDSAWPDTAKTAEGIGNPLSTGVRQGVWALSKREKELWGWWGGCGMCGLQSSQVQVRQHGEDEDDVSAAACQWVRVGVRVSVTYCSIMLLPSPKPMNTTHKPIRQPVNW